MRTYYTTWGCNCQIENHRSCKFEQETLFNALVNEWLDRVEENLAK